MKRIKLSIVALTVAALVSGIALADDKKHEKHDKKEHKEGKADAKAKAYPLKTCVVTDEELGSMGKPYVHQHEGREVQFCCKSCMKDFKKEPAKYLKKLDEAEKGGKKDKK